MKKWQTVKAVLYVTLAVVIFIFSQSIMPYIGYLVGGVVLLYASEELILSAVNRTLFTDVQRVFDGIAQLLICAALFIVAKDVIKLCLIWGVWSILRESKEMAEAIKSIVTTRFGVLNVMESVVVIVLSFLLILEPNDEHIRLHVILLGIEFITVVLFYFLKTWRDKTLKPNSKKEEERLTPDALPKRHK